MKILCSLLLFLFFSITHAQLQITQCAPDSSLLADINCQVALPDFTAQVIAEDIMLPGGAFMVTQSPIPGTIIAEETTMVTFTVDDGIGGSASCQMLFTLLDNPTYCVTAIPDDNFEQALIDLMLDDVLDDQVATSNINSLTNLNLVFKGITDFTGLEAFTALVNLDVRGNLQTALDVSMLHNLKELRAYSNPNLTSLNTTGLTMLEYLRVNNTGLTSLDLSTNINLQHLWAFTLNSLNIPIDISNNLLLEQILIHNSNYNGPLNLSQHTALTYVSLSNNGITTLDLRNGSNTAITFFEAINMSTLTCISVDNAIDADSGLNNYANWNKDITINYSNACGTYIPDDNFEQALITLGYDSGPLDNYVPTAAISGVLSLNIANNTIVETTGIEDFISLETLLINDNAVESINLSTLVNLKTLRTTRNSITTLDLSTNLQLETLIADNNGTETLVINSSNLKSLQVGQNNLNTIDLGAFPLLESLFVYSNNLTALDVSANPMLKRIECQHNMLSVLDFSTLTNLEVIKVFNNELSSFNIKNGNNTIITEFESQNNPDLNCILVDDVAYSTTNWTSIDVVSSFNTVSCYVTIDSKVMLQGAALSPNIGEEHLMRDDLRLAGYIPTLSPYGDNVSVDAATLAITGEKAVVDWIQVELTFVSLNPKTSVNTTGVTQSALVLRDGSIVANDGVSALQINAGTGSYYVTIRHRNHLAIQSLFVYYLSNSNAVTLDFTDANNQITYGTDAQTNFGMPSGVVAMWTGDATADGRLNYLGAQSDLPLIRSQVFNDPDNSVFGGPPVATYQSLGYNATDVNLDGKTIYSGAGSDVLTVRNNIFNNLSNSVFGGPPIATYVFVQQLLGGAN